MCNFIVDFLGVITLWSGNNGSSFPYLLSPLELFLGVTASGRQHHIVSTSQDFLVTSSTLPSIFPLLIQNLSVKWDPDFSLVNWCSHPTIRSNSCNANIALFEILSNAYSLQFPESNHIISYSSSVAAHTITVCICITALFPLNEKFLFSPIIGPTM